MNHTKQQHPFRDDVRLSHLDPKQLECLMAFSQELAAAPQNKKMDVFLSIQKRASQKKITFSSEERNLLLGILTEHMTPEEKKRVELIQKLAEKLSEK